MFPSTDRKPCFLAALVTITLPFSHDHVRRRSDGSDGRRGGRATQKLHMDGGNSGMDQNSSRAGTTALAMQLATRAVTGSQYCYWARGTHAVWVLVVEREGTRIAGGANSLLHAPVLV